LLVAYIAVVGSNNGTELPCEDMLTVGQQSCKRHRRTGQEDKHYHGGKHLHMYISRAPMSGRANEIQDGAAQRTQMSRSRRWSLCANTTQNRCDIDCTVPLDLYLACAASHSSDGGGLWLELMNG